jgi:DNA-binding XRE family transcriptional regulator
VLNAELPLTVCGRLILSAALSAVFYLPAPTDWVHHMARHLVVNGRKVRQLRESANLTQERAAVRIDLAVSSLRRIETGNESVQLTTLGKLARLFGVKPAELVRWIS